MMRRRSEAAVDGLPGARQGWVQWPEIRRRCQRNRVSGVTNSMVRQELGLSRNEAVALLKGLVAEGLLELRGSKRGSHYVLVEPA